MDSKSYAKNAVNQRSSSGALRVYARYWRSPEQQSRAVALLYPIDNIMILRPMIPTHTEAIRALGLSKHNYIGKHGNQ